MTNEQANKIISEYMRKGDSLIVSDTFYMSLDALVPVWEKLGRGIVVFMNEYHNRGTHSCMVFGTEIDEDMLNNNTIQQAAAIATAKAIQELGEI